MASAEDIVFEISGNPHLGCYDALRHAVEIAYEHFPEQLSMSELSATIVPLLKGTKTASSVSRALARATEDAWDNGGQAILRIKYGFSTKPSPKELIFSLACNMKKATTYRLWKQASSGKCGIVARHTDENYWITTMPFLNDENNAAAIVYILNQTNMPMEQFRKLIISDRLLGILDEDFSI